MKRLLFITIPIIFSLSTLWAQSITLDECQQWARENYPQIKQFGFIEKSTQYTLKNTQTAYLPQVSFSSQATYQNHVSEFPNEMKQLYDKLGIDMKGLNKDQYKIGIDVSQTIWDGGMTSTQNRITRSADETEKQKIEIELYTLKERINALYFGILVLNAQEKQNINLQQLLQSNCNKIQTMIHNHTALQSDWDATQAELVSTRQQHTQIVSAEHSYRQMLGLFVHKNLTGAVLSTPLAQNINPTRINRPELHLYEAQQNQISARRYAVYASLRPQINAFAQGFYGNPGLNLFKDMMENKWTWNYIVGIRLRWNFGNLYTKKRDLANLEITNRRIENQKETFLFNTTLTTTAEQNDVDEMKRVLTDDDEIIRLRTSVRKASEAKLNNGIINVNDLLRDITLENIAKIAKTTHEIELLNRIYKLKNTTNQ